jgi:hypothetical protein
MGALVRKNGAWKLASVFVRKAGAWALADVSARASGAWVDTTDPLTCAADPTSFTEYLLVHGADTASTTVTSSGGSSPYTYTWTKDSGPAEVTVLSPTSATTAFRIVDGAYGSTYSSIFRCTVTDANGATAFALISVYFQVDYPT